MTDIIKLAKKLYRRINSQKVPETFSREDQANLIEDAIRQLYVISGRSSQMSDDRFTYDENEMPLTFDGDLKEDEVRWVLLEAEVNFYKWVQASVDDDKSFSYGTDAITLSIAHGDKPFEHLGQTIKDRTDLRDRIWYSMIRYNQLGVSG